MANFIIHDKNREPRVITLTGRQHEVLFELMKGPVLAPSARRTSAYIHKLRGKGIDIETVLHSNPARRGGTYGTYHLRSKVERVKS